MTSPDLDYPRTPEYLAHLARFVTEQRMRLFERILDHRTRHLTVVLEDLYQPQNTSACLRTCDCFGVQDLHVIEHENRFRVHRDVALGATRWLTVHRESRQPNSTSACFERLRDAGYRIVATVPRPAFRDPDQSPAAPQKPGRPPVIEIPPPPTPLDQYDITSKTALVFGSELNGLSATALQQADERLVIPTVGFTESLNISVALAVVLQHLTWKLRQSSVDWQLYEQERLELKIAWARRTVRRWLRQLDVEFQNHPSTGSIQ